MKAKREASMHTQDTERLWWVGRCARCGVARAAVECGPGETAGVSVLYASDYDVKQEPGPVSFRPHDKECA